MNIYGICLVVLGACYKLILLEVSYPYKKAAGDPEKRQTRIAVIFVTSMLVVLSLQTAMAFCHKGPGVFFGKSLICRLMKFQRFLVYLAILIMVFIAKWNDPDEVALMGIGAVLICIFTDLVTEFVEPPISHDDHGHDDEDHPYSALTTA